MTKPSAILIAKMHPLDGFSESERAVIRRFIFECFQGLNEKMDKRWRRWWRRLWEMEVGEVAHIENIVDRSGPFHRMHMAMEQSLFDRQDQWATLESMRDWLKTGAAWGEFALNVRGVMKFVPRSTAYEACSNDEMYELHTAMLAFLRTPGAQRKLWPHLTPDARYDMLEAIVDPEERRQP